LRPKTDLRRQLPSDCGTISFKDTFPRIYLALTCAFLVRWLSPVIVASLLFAGVGITALTAPLVVCSAATSLSMPQQSATSFQIEVEDETGRRVRIPQPARRIVSLAPSVTETLFALDLGDRVVGDTDFCDYPAEAKKKPHVGGPVNPSVEAIAALHPDIVIASREINLLDSVQSLEQIGIPVYATDPHTVEEVLTSTQRLADLLGAAEAGRAVVKKLRSRLDELDRRLADLPPKDALMIVWLDPLISVGRNAFLNDALRRAGAHSIINSPQAWPTIDLEEVVRAQPEYLIISNDNRQQVERELDELQKRPAWRQLEAVRSRRVIVLSEAISHPSPRLIDGIEQLARALYPSKFDAAMPRVRAILHNDDIVAAMIPKQGIAFTEVGASI
jgi:iron complex transport system substrate-binding protein